MEEIFNQWIDEHKSELVDTVKRLVEIPSVLEEGKEGAPFGEPIRHALEAVLDIASAMNFEVHNYDGYAGRIRMGEGEKEVGILSHIDVVPAGNPDDWEYPPFSPVENEGKLFGRGVLDDKGPMVAALFAMKAIRESGLPLKNSICHIIGTDEETAHRGLEYYLKQEKAPWGGFSPDANFPVIHGEKGIMRFSVEKSWDFQAEGHITLISIEGGTVLNAVPASVKAVFRCDEFGKEQIQNTMASNTFAGVHAEYLENEVHIVAAGVSTHAMQPWDGENAIQKLLPVLELLPLGIYSQWVHMLNSLFGGGWNGEGLGIACEDQLSGPLTMNFATIKMNASKCVCGFDIRYPIHIDPEKLWNTIKMTCEGAGFDIIPGRMRNALYVPQSSGLVSTLLNAYNEFTGSSAEPVVIGGGTYCRDVDNFVSFGPVFPGDKEVAHEPNEYIEIDKLISCAKIYAQALYVLAQR